VAAIEGLTSAMLAVLGENEIKTLDDLGDLAGDELIEMLPDFDLAEEEANDIIMAARAHWFDDEEEPAAEEAAEAEEEGSDA
jgi:N utilization substance protein A